jgi:hypothetical protein
MGFFGDAPLRRVLIVRGSGALLVAAVLAVTLLLSPLGPSIGPLGIVLILLIVAFGVQQILQARRTPTATVVHPHPHPNPDHLPPAERTRYLRNQLIIGAVVFSSGSLWLMYQLNRLEQGTAESVMLWSPIGFLYDHFGYWTAVLALPGLGLLILCSLLAKLTNPPDRR